MKEKYRIIKETDGNGRITYYIQERILFFWVFVRECRDITMFRYRREYKTLEEAQNTIQLWILDDETNKRSKQIKREIC